MASASAGAARTPLESVFSYIPPSHEKGVKQALFNVAALAGVITVGAIGLATYAVFQPFIKPLLWALLLGTVTHPMKRRLTAAARRWLADLECSGSPLFLHALLAPVWAFDAAADTIGNAAMRHIRALAAFVVAIAVVNVVWFYTPSVPLAMVWLVSHGVIENLLWLLRSIFYNKLLCWSLLAGYVIAVVFFWSPSTRRFAVPCWLLLLGFLSGLAGSLAGPIFVALVALMAVGFVTEVLARRREQQDEGINVSMSKTIVAIMYDESITCDQSTVEPVLTEPVPAADPAGHCEPLSPGPAGQTEPLSPGDSMASMPSLIMQSPADLMTSPPDPDATPTGAGSSSRAAAFLAQKGMTSTPLSRVRPRTLQSEEAVDDAEEVVGPAAGSFVQTISDQSGETTDLRPPIQTQPAVRPSGPSQPALSSSQTTTYITAVAYCCLVVIVWQRIWLISMLPIVIVHYFCKRIVISSWQSGGRDTVVAALQPAFAWLQERREGIMPLPVRGVWKLILRGNCYLIAGVQGSVDAVVTIVVVLGALFFVTFVAVFAAVQIYGETVRMIEMAGSVFNQTVLANPDLQAMMPDNMNVMVEQMIDNGYIYGKDYISKVVRDLTKGAGAQSQDQLERETLELWSRLYQAWVSSVVAAPAVGPVVDATGVASAWQVWLEKVQSYPDLLTMDAVKAAVQDNLETVLSVLDSSWTILRSNVTMLTSVVTQLISVLLGGGFAVLNSLLNMIVFVTALFYLLSSSGHLYKPVELITKLGPVSRGSSRFVMAVDEAVSSVFVASFKMAVFYLLWTWLVHSLFAVKFVYLPSVVAAVLGAVPFLGSYWAALPAVLELWLVHAQPLTALLFFTAQLAPILFVDTAIYSEVKGGHPYLTGLAIAGGIFWLGIEGAILGPVLLCCLLVAVNVYSNLVNTPDLESKPFAGRLKRSSD